MVMVMRFVPISSTKAYNRIKCCLDKFGQICNLLVLCELTIKKIRYHRITSFPKKYAQVFFSRTAETA